MDIKPFSNLHKANLCNAKLRHADLRGSNLSEANLTGADLYSADLRFAFMYNTNLNNVNLYSAKMYYADISNTNLEDVLVPPVIFPKDFVSEMLWRNANTTSQKDFAALIFREHYFIWSEFRALAKKKRVLEWSKKILFKWKEYETLKEVM